MHIVLIILMKKKVVCSQIQFKKSQNFKYFDFLLETQITTVL